METSALDDFDLNPDRLAEVFDDTGAGEELERAGVTYRQKTAPTVDETAPIPGAGPLLEEPKAAKVFSTIDREVRSQERLRKNRQQQDIHYDRVRRGVPLSYLIKSEDRSIIKAELADGISDSGLPIPNKIDDLCTKVVSQVSVDPFLPNPKPDGDTDRNRGAADLTKKYLRHEGGPNGLDWQGMLRSMLTTNMTRSAAYQLFWVDKTGGGWRPKQIKAHPQAVDPKNPLMGPKVDPTTKQPMVDELTGRPVLERCTDPILRYVAEVEDPLAMDAIGSPIKKLVFTENASEAVRQFLPKHKRKDLLRSQIVTIPRTATVPRAQAVTVLMWETVGEARRRFAVLDALPKEKIKELCAWRPKRWQDIVPDAMRPKGEDAEPGNDSSLLFWYAHFCRQGDDYLDGGEIHVTGAKGGVLLKRDTMREDVEVEDGTTVPVLMRPPVAEFIALQDQADVGDPQGRPPIAAFEGAGQLWAHLYLAIIDCLDKGLNPNIYLPSTSTVTREDIHRRDGTPIEILVPEDKPEYEKPYELPSFLPQILQNVEEAMTSAAQTNETGRGLDSPYSISGKAKEVALGVAKTLLAQYWQNSLSGTIQSWQIVLEQAQAFMTVPMLTRLSGEDSAYKAKSFVGSDLIGASDVALAPGSGTMMSGQEKLNWLAMLAGGNAAKQAWIDPELAGELARASMADDLGLPPNVHEEHINRQISDWVDDGPPKNWIEEYTANQQAKTAYQAALNQRVAQLAYGGIEMTAAQQQAQQEIPPVQEKPLYTPFEPRPNDDSPIVAKIREAKLSRLMSTVDYKRHGSEWATCVDNAYALAAPAAGIVTVKQQQEAQAAQAQAQQQAAQQAETMKMKMKQQEIAAKTQLEGQHIAAAAEEGDKTRAAAAEHDDKSIAGTLQQELIRSTAREGPRATTGTPLPSAD